MCVLLTDVVVTVGLPAVAMDARTNAEAATTIKAVSRRMCSSPFPPWLATDPTRRREPMHRAAGFARDWSAPDYRSCRGTTSRECLRKRLNGHGELRHYAEVTRPV